MTPRWRSYGIECLEVQFVDLWTCVVLRFVFFVARYLNYIEQRCCISDTVRSIGWLVALLSKSAGKNKVIIAAGVLFFFRRTREEIEIFEVIKIGRKTWKNWEKTGQNWAKLGKTGENRVKLGKIGRTYGIEWNWKKNSAKPFKTGKNWEKLGKTA